MPYVVIAGDSSEVAESAMWMIHGTINGAKIKSGWILNQSSD